MVVANLLFWWGIWAYAQVASLADGIAYTNYRVAKVPWSVHVVQWDRTDPVFVIHTEHAGGGALGLARLTDQIPLLKPELGRPVAAVNGDFYQRDMVYAGDPRGLQIMEGEVISAPMGGAAFWIDAFGHPRVTNVVSRFTVTWPNGAQTRFGLNEERRKGALVLYTPAAGSSTHTSGGRELVLEREGAGPWLPLGMGETYLARVREVREAGDTHLEPQALVLSLDPAAASVAPKVEPGAALRLDTASIPNLWHARAAISGGPVLVRKGRPQPLPKSGTESYQYSSMSERHPRTAIGWNQRYFLLVEVDGRQKDLSVGMTLEELAGYLADLGCEEAMNLDGGGSSILWYEGKIRNSPCDGREREIANSIIVLRKNIPAGASSTTAKGSAD